MPIIAKNITVGAKPPAVLNEKSAQLGSRIKVFGKVINKSKPEPVQQKIIEVKKPEVVEVVDKSKYLHKQDGELIRHINRKSAYLRDLLELE